MILFGKLQLQNFLSVSFAEVNLDNQGLVLIEGVNKDDPSAKSNGAGKSSIVDGISWALYGVTARGVTGDDVINLEAGKDTMVQLDFVADKCLYRVTRFRNHIKYKNRVRLWLFDDDDGMWSDITLGTDKLTQVKINDLIGASDRVFNSSIYMGQEQMPDLPSMTDKMLKSIIEEATELEKIDRAGEIVRARAALIESNLQECVAEVVVCNANLDAVQKRKKLIAGYWETACNELHAINHEYGNLHRATILSEKDATANLQYALAAAPPAPAPIHGELTAIEADYASAMVDVNAMAEKLGALKTRMNALEDDLKKTNANIARLKQSGACMSCGRAFDDADSVQAHLDVEERTRAKLLESIERGKTMYKDLFNNVTKARAEADLNATKARAAALAANDTHAEWQKKIDLLRASVEIAKAKAKDIEETWARMIKAKGSQIDSYLADLKQCDGDEEKLFDQIKEVEDQKDKLRNEIEVYDKAIHILGRKGFRGELLDYITPYLNTRTEHYLYQLTSGNISAEWMTLTQNSLGDYVESFHIEIKHSSGVGNFGNLSGGEKRKVRLACALALQDLVASRAIKPIKLFVADEIDDAIDEAGLELLMGLLEEKANEMGTVLVISHNDIGDWVRNKITVTKENKTSTITSSVMV